MDAASPIEPNPPTQAADASGAPDTPAAPRPVVEVPQPVPPSAMHSGHQGWTFILLSLGIGVIACCMLIPAADENHRLVFEVSKLSRDLEHLQRQAAINDEFLARVGHDPSLSERLAQRQMRFVPKGTTTIKLEEPVGTPGDRSSPWALVTLPSPELMPELKLGGGKLAELCRDSRSRLYLLGSGLMLMAMGLVLGAAGGSGDH